MKHSVGNNINREEICPEVELLNQACLDLVAQIEELKDENAQLKKRVREGREAEATPKLSGG